MLTQEDVLRLSRPFPLEAHEWRKGRNNRDYVYITESGVVGRLNEVDPSWSLVVTDRVEREYTTARKDAKGEAHAITSHELAITVCLTVKDVARYGIGMAEVAADAAEADKSAVTDALKRAARLFGVGGYLLNGPPGKSAFPQWLKRQSVAHSEAVEATPEDSLFESTVDVMRAVIASGSGVQFQVWSSAQAAGEPEILLSRALVEQLRDSGAVTRDSLNMLMGQAKLDGQSDPLPLTQPVRVTFTFNGEFASAESVTLLAASNGKAARAAGR